MAEDIWERVKRELINKKGEQHSSTETDGNTETQSHVITPDPRPNWLDVFVTEEDTEAERRKTKIAIKRTKTAVQQKAAALFDQAETTRVKRESEAIERAEREKQILLSNLDWCAPYNLESECQKTVMEYAIDFNGISSACERGASVDENIRDHVLHTIDEILIPDQENINKREEFLHKTLIAYLGFCKYRVSLVEGCEASEELRPIYLALEDTYNLAYQVIAKSIVLRNHDATRKLGKEEFKKLWYKEGFCWEKSMKVIDDLADAFAEYFKEASMEEKMKYNKQIHSQDMKDLLDKLEKDTGLIDFASKIVDYV